MNHDKRRLLLVGWDAADWKVINPLLDAGEMPNLARLVENGVVGNLATLYPAYSPMLWTSIATGKRATKHGIHGFIEPLPDGAGVRPVSSLSRKVKAVWNILSQSGRKAAVIGWWPSHPVDPIDGVMVSEMYTKGGDGAFAPPLPRGTVHPPEWRSRLEDLRVASQEVPGELLRMFAPDFHKVDQSQDSRVHSLAHIIAETMTTHGAATEVLENAEWDFAAVYYDALDHFSHGFMRYHPPRLPWVMEEDFAIFSPIVANACRYHDAMLGRLLALAGPETTVLVLSDHGFHPDHHRKAQVPAEMAGPSVEHRHFGIFCLSGPGIRKDERVYGASLLDITPTILHLFGLPVGRDMDGKVLSPALEPGAPAVAYVDTWENVPGPSGIHSRDTQPDPGAAAEAMKQLVALGYIAPPSPDLARDIAQTVTELKYNLARCHDDEGKRTLAIPLYREILAANPGEHRAAECLFEDLIILERHGEAAEVMARFEEAIPAISVAAAAELARRRELSPDSAFRSRSDADRLETYERRELAEQANGYVLLRALMPFKLALAEGRFEDAERHFERLLRICETSRIRVPAMVVAKRFTVAGKTKEALEWVGRALDDDGEDFGALALGAILHLREDRHEEARDFAIRSLGLVYFQPQIHFVLGFALRKLGDLKGAEQALRVALVQAPGYDQARMTLAELYLAEGRIGDSSLQRATAERFRASREEIPAPEVEAPPAEVRQKPRPRAEFPDRPAGPAKDPSREIVVITGLPRSGTSMMMQTVVAGGVPPLTDGRRVADEDNPRGYFEFERATHLRTDKTWVPEARGKVVKLVLPLVPYLPRGERYRVIVIRRDLKEVVTSQRRMLERLGRTDNAASLTGQELESAYLFHEEAAVAWLRRRRLVACLQLWYAEVLADPAETARRIGEFLGRPFDRDACAAAVRPELRRQFAPV